MLGYTSKQYLKVPATTRSMKRASWVHLLPRLSSWAEGRNWALVFDDGLAVGGLVDQGQGEQFPHACLLLKDRLRQAA